MVTENENNNNIKTRRGVQNEGGSREIYSKGEFKDQDELLFIF